MGGMWVDKYCVTFNQTNRVKKTLKMACGPKERIYVSSIVTVDVAGSVHGHP